MLPEIEKLLVVQERDRRIAALKKDLARVPADVEAARSRLGSDEKSLADAQAALAENEVATKNLELDVETRRNTIARLKTQQFETRKNDEFAALGSEIIRYTDEITKLEDQELELMEKAEGLRAAVGEAAAKVGKTQGHVDEEISSLQQRQLSCEDQIAATRADRDSLASSVDPDLLSQYDRIFKNKKDAAVVALAGGTCTGCHMKVTTATAHAVHAAQQITNCENCGRFLFEE